MNEFAEFMTYDPGYVACPVKPILRHVKITARDVELGALLDMDPATLATARQPLPESPFL